MIYSIVGTTFRHVGTTLVPKFSIHFTKSKHRSSISNENLASKLRCVLCINKLQFKDRIKMENISLIIFYTDYILNILNN